MPLKATCLCKIWINIGVKCIYDDIRTPMKNKPLQEVSFVRILHTVKHAANLLRNDENLNYLHVNK